MTLGGRAVRLGGDVAIALTALAVVLHVVTAATLVAVSPFTASVSATLALMCAACAWHSYREPGIRAWAVGAAATAFALGVHVLLGGHAPGDVLPGAHHNDLAASATAIRVDISLLHTSVGATMLVAEVVQLVMLAAAATGHSVPTTTRSAAENTSIERRPVPALTTPSPHPQHPHEPAADRAARDWLLSRGDPRHPGRECWSQDAGGSEADEGSVGVAGEGMLVVACDGN